MVEKVADRVMKSALGYEVAVGLWHGELLLREEVFRLLLVLFWRHCEMVKMAKSDAHWSNASLLQAPEQL